MADGRQVRWCDCGTRLARDNTAALCRSCETARRGSGSAPPDVPASFWETRELQEAFAARHIGKVLNAYRRHRWHGAKFSQARVAGWLRTTQAQVSRAENGPPPQDLQTLIAWAGVLRIPARHLWFTLPDEPIARPPSSAALVQPVDVSAIHAASQAFRLADRQSGGGHLYRTVRHYLQVEVGPQLVTLRSRRDSAAVFAASASLTEMIGWMAHDSGDDVLAAEHLAQALRLAAAADDLVLQANILASMSHLAGSVGRSGEGVTHARSGLDLLARTSCHVVASRLHAMEARGHAVLGDERGCREAPRQAEDVLCKPADEAPSQWASPFDEASLASEAASSLRALGQLSEAARQVGRVLELRRHGRARSRALGQLALAAIGLDQGEVDAAALLGSEVLAGVRAVQSARVRSQLLGLGRSLRGHGRAATAARFLASLRQQEASLSAPVLLGA